MTSAARFQLEIDYPGERNGWINSYLVIDGQRRRVWTSGALPPFADLAQFVRAIAAQRLPFEFFWEEEGPDIHFEALPVAPDSPTFRLRIVRTDHQDADPPVQVWLDAELERQAVVETLVETLYDFALEWPSAGQWWACSRAMVQELADFVRGVYAPRSNLQVAEPITFRFSRLDIATEITFSVLGMPVKIWPDDNDRFWPNWFAFLEQLLQQEPSRISLELHWVNQDWLGLTLEAAQEEGRPPEFFERRWGYCVQAASLPHPRHFRFYITETSWQHIDYIRLDEVLDRKQFVHAFCQAFEAFLRFRYHPHPDGERNILDLRTLPLERLRRLLES